MSKLDKLVSQGEFGYQPSEKKGYQPSGPQLQPTYAPKPHGGYQPARDQYQPSAPTPPTEDSGVQPSAPPTKE